ncbi:imidazolonepropionase [uncultured Roseibium sp.]|uniref:imidazolonepropionase n=1 Tax=uncultured Roseibium sp. TaxID=1936171 RepID=UPI00261445A8|nr:imidazolonepropionase [uncultured Roseibium sp.]
MSRRLLTNAKLATFTANGAAYGLVEQGALVIDGDRLAFAGRDQDLSTDDRELPSEDLEGRLVTPGLIDCHTHVVFGGNRAREFEMRLQGASYEEIARAGGGIVSTVSATREASEEELLASALTRVDALIREGVTAIEVKSGYGLDRETELRMLRTARSISKKRPIRIRTSFLGAHAIPAEYKERSDAYLEEICLPTLEEANSENLVDAVDGFCEGIAFSPEQIARVFDKAKELGLPVKLHAEQLSNLGGTALAASYGALSADHLEFLDEAGVQALGTSGSVAVLLPGAFYTLRETQLPPLELLRQAGVPVALATDCNPGSSPLASLLTTMNMGCTLFRMTPEEALAGVTREAARALNLEDQGCLKAGMRADLAIWDVDHPAELSYRIGFNSLQKRIFGGSE